MDWGFNSEGNQTYGGSYWWKNRSKFWSWAERRRSDLNFIVFETMGGICSRRSTVDNAPSGTFSQPNGITDHGVPSKTNNNLTPPQLGPVMDKQVRESFSFPEMNNVNNNALTSNQNDVNDGIPRLSRSLSHKSRSTKSRPAAVAKELYHELHALDRFEQDYQRKLQEEDNSNAAQRGTIWSSSSLMRKRSTNAEQ